MARGWVWMGRFHFIHGDGEKSSSEDQNIGKAVSDSCLSLKSIDLLLEQMQRHPVCFLI
jgi:hypothetical protein